MKRITAYCLVILSVLGLFTFFVSCDSSKEQTKTSTTTTTYPSFQISGIPGYEYPAEMMIESGIWAVTERENQSKEGVFVAYRDGEIHSSIYISTDLMRSMRTAKYEKTDEAPTFCEAISIRFVRNGEKPLDCSVLYLYSYESKQLYCLYNKELYLITDYEALVSDLTYLDNGYSYEKWLFDMPYTDKAGITYKACFAYERFFARKTGFDPSIYSGFSTTEEVLDMNEEKACSIAKKELENFTSNVKLIDCYFDPFTKYWRVGSGDDDRLWDVYLNEKGLPIQITPGKLLNYGTPVTDNSAQ